MIVPTHHLDDDVLLAYVTGTATEPVSLVVACHLTLCAKCRGQVAAAELVGGALLDGQPMAALSEDALGRALGRLDDQSLAGPPPPPASRTDEPFVFAGLPLPRPLARYLTVNTATGDSQRTLRFLAPGVRGVDLPLRAPPAVRTRLLRLAPGVEIPRHAHAAPEFTLVFSGGLSEGDEHYGRGDVRFLDTAGVHVQRVDSNGPCVALVVNEGALLPQTWRGKLVSFLFDR
jgi:putative transcriptional regulator